MRGWDVGGLQWLLARHGFPSGAMDGGLGPRTDAALRRFQAWAGLGADGLAGPATLARLRSAAAREPADLRAAAADRARRTGSARAATGSTRASTTRRPRARRVAAAGRGCVTFAGWDPAATATS